MPSPTSGPACGAAPAGDVLGEDDDLADDDLADDDATDEDEALAELAELTARR